MSNPVTITITITVTVTIVFDITITITITIIAFACFVITITITITNSITIYELTSDTTRTLIGQKSQKPMFCCTGKLPLHAKAALRSTTRKDE